MLKFRNLLCSCLKLRIKEAGALHLLDVCIPKLPKPYSELLVPAAAVQVLWDATISDFLTKKGCQELPEFLSKIRVHFTACSSSRQLVAQQCRLGVCFALKLFQLCLQAQCVAPRLHHH